MAKRSFNLITFLQQNAGWLHTLAVLCFAILALWLNSHYITIATYQSDQSAREAAMTLFIKENSAQHMEINQAITKLVLTLEGMKKHDEELGNHDQRIKQLEIFRAGIEARQEKKQ